jgi:MinD superfamily P-loop ATPase
MNYTITINESRCVSCGTCAEECQRHLPVHRVGEPTDVGLECISCLHCYAICPQGAISIDFDESIAVPEQGNETESLINLTARRRSCRR